MIILLGHHHLELISYHNLELNKKLLYFFILLLLFSGNRQLPLTHWYHRAKKLYRRDLPWSSLLTYSTGNIITDYVAMSS